MFSKVRSITMLFVLLLAVPLLAENAKPVVQPKDIPGKFNITPQPFPPLAEIVEAPAQDKAVYGLYIWAEEYRILREEIRKIGWKQFRIAGPWDDLTMRAVVEDDVEVMLTFGEKGRKNFKSDEDFIATCMKSIDKLLTRYGPRGSFFKDNPGLPVRPITALEIWNEPNFQYMIPDRQPQAEVEREREALYAKLLPAAFKTIKAKWPEVRVVGFGAGGAGAGDMRFIDNVTKKDPKQIPGSYNILSTHPYVSPVPPETDSVQAWGSYSITKSLAVIRGMIGKSVPIWYTELGWDVSKADGGFYETSGGPKTNPQLQAAYICRMYALAMRLGVARVHVMHAFDTDHCNFGFFMHNKTFGNILPDQKSWRPSAFAVQNMIKLMPFPKMAGVINDGQDNWYAWNFIADARIKVSAAPLVTMAYCVTGPKHVEMEWTAPAANCVDMLGSTRKINAKPAGEGKWTLPVDIGPCPIYLTTEK